MCELPTASSNKKINKKEIILLTGCGPADFDPTKACFKRSRWFGKRHKMDAFTKLGEPTIRAACTPQTVLDRRFFYQYLAIFPAVLLYPQQNRAYSALHPQALTDRSPLDFQRSSIKKKKKKKAHIKDITATSKAFKMIIINRHTRLKTNLEL